MERDPTPPRGNGTRPSWQAHQPSTPRNSATQQPHTPRSPRHTPVGRGGWRAADTLRHNPSFSRSPTHSPEHGDTAPLARSKASEAWKRLLEGDSPLLVKRGTPQAPLFSFPQGGDAQGLHSSIATACADAWQQSPPQGLALLNAACENLDAPTLWCRLLRQHAVQLQDAANTASPPQLSGIVRAVRFLFEQDWCNPQSPWHLEAPARQALQTWIKRLDPTLALRLTLAEIEQRLGTVDSRPLSASQAMELLRRLHESATQALELPDFVQAQRIWGLGKRVAALFPPNPHGLDAAVLALANALGKSLRPPLQREHQAGLGDWIVFHIDPPDGEGHTLTRVQLQDLETDEQRQQALGELRAWLQTQLTRPRGQRLLGWADVQRVTEAVSQALSWQPSAPERLRWCLLEAEYGLNAEPLIALLCHGSEDSTLDGPSLQAILRLVAEPALALADRVELLRYALPLLPPKEAEPELHRLCLRSLQAIGDEELRSMLRKQYDQRFGSVFPEQRLGPDHSPLARVRERARQWDRRGGDWDELTQGLELSITLTAMPQLRQAKGSELLDRLRHLSQHTGRPLAAERLARLGAWAEQLLQRLKADPEGAASLLCKRCELLCRDLRQAQHKAIVARLQPWFEASPRASAAAPLKCQRLDLQSPELASPEARQQAWSLFLDWLVLELALPGGPPWEGIADLVDEVAQALQVQPEADLLSRLRHVVAQRAPARPQTEAPTAVTPWFSITSMRLNGGTQLSIRVARGAQAPANDDEYQSAQTALFNLMLHELQKPDGADWPALLDLVHELESAWKPWRLDRQRLLGLCLWQVAHTGGPGALLQLLPLLEDPDEAILSALLEQAVLPQWSPLLRAALLQAVIKWLPVGPQALGPLTLQTLQACLAHDDAGTRLTLLAQFRQRHLGDAGSESGVLLKTLLTLESLDEPSNARLTGVLEGIHQRERRAPRPLWLELCRVLLARVAPHLLALSRSNDDSAADKAGDLLRSLLWRMAHPEAGDRAQALEDQFELLAHLAAAVPSEERATFLHWLDDACARQLKRALMPQRQGAQPKLPMAALAMRGAIAVLSAGPGRLPKYQAAVDHVVANAGVRFFTDWFQAAQADADRSMARLLLKAKLVALDKDPLAQELSGLADGLMRLHGQQQV